MKKMMVYFIITFFLTGCLGEKNSYVGDEPNATQNQDPPTAQTTATTLFTEDLEPTATEEISPTPTQILMPWPPEGSSWPVEGIAPWPTNGWSTSFPEAQGIDSQELVDMLEYIDDQRSVFDSLLLIRNGYLVLEVYWKPNDENTMHAQYSLTKTVVSTLVGIAYKDGYLQDVHQPVLDLFPNLVLDDIEENILSISVNDVLTMSAGMDWEGVTPEEILAGVLNHEPGTYFEYGNSGPQLMLDAVQQMTGMDPLQFANERLFSPLGISSENIRWDLIGAGNYRDGAGGLGGLYLRPRDMAKIGYLYLNNGEWDGEEILPASWIAQAISPNTFENFSGDDFPTDGYGYFLWINRGMGFYSGVGAGGQLIVVFPGKNMILVTTGDIRASRGFIHYSTLSNFIVPLTLSDSPLPENPSATAELQALINKFSGLDE